MFCLATYATLGISKYTYLAVMNAVKNENVLVTKCDGAQ